MKVIYKETIVDKIKHLLHKEDKPIEKIVLERDEWEELLKYAFVQTSSDGSESGYFFGVKVEKEKPLTKPYTEELWVYKTYGMAKDQFDYFRNKFPVAGVNVRDLVLNNGNKRVKFGVLGSAVQWEKFAGHYYDEIWFDDFFPQTEQEVFKLQHLKKYQ